MADLASKTIRAAPAPTPASHAYTITARDRLRAIGIALNPSRALESASSNQVNDSLVIMTPR